MKRNTVLVLTKSLFTALLIGLASTAGASSLQLTFSGSYYAPVLDPATGCCFTYYNPNGSLPFPQPADGTAFTATVLMDANQPTPIPGNFANNYTTDQTTLDFGGLSFTTASSGSLNIFNDTPPGVLPFQFPHANESPDVWLLGATFTNGDFFNIFFVEPADTTAAADALLSSDFTIPDPSQFSLVFMQYRTLAGDYVVSGITSVDAQVIPVPAAFWLFGSALLGLFGLKRRA